MSDKLQLETGDALLQEDGSSFILTIAAVDAPKTFPPLDVPARRASLAIASLTIGLSLLQSTLAPTPAAALTVTQSTTLIQAKKPAPPWDPPNLLTTTLAPAAEAEKPFTQREWPVPPSRRLQWLVTSETRIGADDAVVAGDPVKPLDWPLPQVKASSIDLRTWTRSRPTYYTEPLLTLSARPIAWPNPPVKPVDANRWTWLQSRPSYYTDALAAGQPTTQASTLLQGKRPAPAWTPPNLLQNTLAPVAAGNPPIRQHNWPLPQSAPPRPIATLQFIGYYVFQVQQDPFVSTTLELPAPRKPAPQTWTQNLLETTLGAPAAGLSTIRQYAWPNPTGKSASLALRTWTQLRPPFFVESKPFFQSEWPNPQPVKPAPRDWIQRPAVVSGETPPIRNIEWLAPPLKTASLDLKTWLQPRPSFYTEPKPFSQADWPDPWPFRPAPPLWTQSPDIPTQTPFSQTDWPNPKPLKPAPHVWTQSPAIRAASPEIRLYDWPNPRVKLAAFDLRTWIQPRPSFYVEPKPIRPLDWPLPRIKTISIDLRTWIQKRPTYYIESTANLVVTIHTVGLDVFQTVGAGLDIRPDPGAGLDVFATGTAGLDVTATPSAGVSDRAAPAGLDIGQSLPAGLSDAT